MAAGNAMFAVNQRALSKNDLRVKLVKKCVDQVSSMKTLDRLVPYKLQTVQYAEHVVSALTLQQHSASVPATCSHAAYACMHAASTFVLLYGQMVTN